MNTAPGVMHVLLAIAFTMVAQMKLAVACFPQTTARVRGR